MSKKELTKEQRIKKEINRLKKLFKDMPKNTLSKVNSLIENAAFMSVTLEDLQKEINDNGTMSEYKNGENQYGTKRSPAFDGYNAMIKNHMGIIKQLTDLMPEAPKQDTKKEDPLFNIINRGKNG